MKPLVFVAMPFGRKKDSSGQIEVNFDLIYKKAIEPAILELGYDVIRADEEHLGGFIHLPMYERLLASEFVIADLTFANANVYYELGIRQRCGSYIDINSKRSQLYDHLLKTRNNQNR